MTCPPAPALSAASGEAAASAVVIAARRVELVVESNHGREELTCLYRFMVHGTPHTPPAPEEDGAATEP